MLAMQYSITLPADYEMQVIRQRIATKGSLMDGFDGLLFKAFLYAQRGVHGPQNLYAPFYVWRNTAGMNRFLGGEGFVALTQSFGWPAVKTWSVLEVQSTSNLRAAMQATREIVPWCAHVDLAQAMEEERVAAREAVNTEGALAAVAAYEPGSWWLVRTRLWPAGRALEDREDVQRYAVGYVATA